MFKKIYFIFVCLFLASVGFSQDKEEGKSIFSLAHDGIKFFSPQDVMRAYLGSWSGFQEIRFGANEARGRIEITYTEIQSQNGMRIMGVGRVTSSSGRSVPTSSYMYVENNILTLEMRTESGVASFYKGAIDFSSVIWIPKYSFMRYDFQQDFFFVDKGTPCINALGAREILYRNKVGLLEIKTQFRQLKSGKPASEINSAVKKNININLDGGSGVKFGE
ncbi:MAG: hypothetical protein E7035_05900 [Verrucomicrobiaceae bacterium]|nr:hypothetical protein [Verrucomicrobiaceae bacterium]